MSPSIPLYNSREQVQPRAISPQKNDSQIMGQDNQNLVNTITDVGQLWLQAHDTMQITRAKADYETGAAQIEAESQTYTGDDKETYFKEKLNKLKETTIGSIDNKGMANLLAVEFDKNNALSLLKIKNTAMKMEMVEADINISSNVDSYAKDRQEAATDVEKKDIDRKTYQLIEENVNRGIITPARGREHLNNYRLGSVDLDIMRDTSINTSDSYVHQELLKGKEGAYPELTDKERADRLEDSELHIKRNKQLGVRSFKKQQRQNEGQLLSDIGTENVTRNKVRDMQISAAIDEKFADKYKEKMYYVPPEETNHATYNEIKMRQLKGADDGTINMRILDGIERLTPEDKDSLLKSRYNPADEKAISMRASVQALRDWAYDSLAGMTFNKQEEIVYQFLQKVDKEGVDMDSAMKEIQRSYIKETYPDTTTLDDIPNIVGNRNKLIKVYNRESKAGGQKTTISSGAFDSIDIGFDDL